MVAVPKRSSASDSEPSKTVVMNFGSLSLRTVTPIASKESPLSKSKTLDGTHDGSRHAVPTLNFPSRHFCHQTTAFAWLAHAGAPNRAYGQRCFFLCVLADCVWTICCRNGFRSPQSVRRGNVSAVRPQHLTGYWMVGWPTKMTGLDRLGSFRSRVRSRSRLVSPPHWIVVPPWLRAGSTSTTW